MKKWMIFLFLLAAVLPVSAQTAKRLEGEPRDAAIATILKANDLKTTLQFRFVMTRHSSLLTEDLVSRGRAAFAFPDKVRWEVEQPNPSLFVLDGAAVTDRRQQTLLRNVAKLSDKGLINETDFTVTVYASPSQWQVDLVPLRRDLAQMFSLITLLTDPVTGDLRSVVLTETGGDTMDLQLLSVVKGQKVDPALFQAPQR